MCSICASHREPFVWAASDDLLLGCGVQTCQCWSPLRGAAYSVKLPLAAVLSLTGASELWEGKGVVPKVNTVCIFWIT